ncbi:fungal-specific transcription factor domain-containing protein [Xylogone sp. PMI_703]|nr:fungal-specific transcription factor domain-containing protein [Xylogone sp. PMI_703]
MSSPRTETRPYRSHLRPACLACRRRKSRCTIESNSTTCLLCRVHGGECVFPVLEKSSKSKTVARKRRKTESNEVDKRPIVELPRNDHLNGLQPVTQFGSRPLYSADQRRRLVQRSSEEESGSVSARGETEERSTLMATLGETEHESSHIVGPAVANDAQVLDDYLSLLPSGDDGPQRMTRRTPFSLYSKGPRGPVLYTSIQKRPVGVTRGNTVGLDRCETIERLVEPFGNDLVDLYFEKINLCFPLLDETSFKRHYQQDKSRITPALLTGLYASSLIFWQRSPKLRQHHCPNGRFVWVQAMEALHTELFLEPCVSSIVAALFCVAGRPTTTMTGNAMVLASALALTRSLGLNRNPATWPISEAEKSLRVRVWWGVLIHDRWCSFAYGTPPHINGSEYDVPMPTLKQLLSTAPLARRNETVARTFLSLCSLTEVLGSYLEYIYDINKESKSFDSLERQIRRLEVQLDDWETENFHDEVAGTVPLSSPGAANLRLAYLAIKLLLRRIDLDLSKQNQSEQQNISYKRHRAIEAAANIVTFLNDLTPQLIADFWLPVNAFSLTSAITLLLRCEVELIAAGKASSNDRPLEIARQLLDILCKHRDESGWDIGDICLSQYSGIVDRLLEAIHSEPQWTETDLEEMMMPGIAIRDDLFPSLWDMLDTRGSSDILC